MYEKRKKLYVDIYRRIEKQVNGNTEKGKSMKRNDKNA